MGEADAQKTVSYIQEGFNPPDIQHSSIHIAPAFKPGNRFLPRPIPIQWG